MVYPRIDFMEMAVKYNITFVVLSVLVAMFASYVALEFATVLTQAKGRAKWAWLACGALAMGIGIWSMHFVGMLAFDMPGMAMAYDVPLMVLSIFVAIGASALALVIVSRPTVSVPALVAGGCAMAAAIAGMHYIGMYSMRMTAHIEWNYLLVALSVVIALVASFGALFIARRIRHRTERTRLQLLASGVMGIAISGMHYTGMFAATFVHDHEMKLDSSALLATDGLAVAVIGATVVILAFALASSVVDRAFTIQARKTFESTQLYKNAERAVAALKEERELRDRFMSALAHDLRTPLAAARMSAQLGIRQSTNPEAVEKNCARTVETLQRMDHMIQDLLDAHRITAGRGLNLQLEPCKVRELLKSVVEELTTVHGQRFELLCDNSLEAQWDAHAVRRAVENLCNNAVKYGRSGGRVTIDVRPRAGRKAWIGVHNLGETIDEAERARLFELFQRGRAAEASDRKGWGLGLTIVKGVADAHGGNVSVTSEAKGENTFAIELPLEPRPNTPLHGNA